MGRGRQFSVLIPVRLEATGLWDMLHLPLKIFKYSPITLLTLSYPHRGPGEPWDC